MSDPVPRLYGPMNPGEFDGYEYAVRWSNGDLAWWSTKERAEKHLYNDFMGEEGTLVCRRLVVGKVEEVIDPKGVLGTCRLTRTLHPPCGAEWHQETCTRAFCNRTGYPLCPRHEGTDLTTPSQASTLSP